MGSFLPPPDFPQPAARSVLPVTEALKPVPSISQLEDAQDDEKVSWPRQKSPAGQHEALRISPFLFLCCGSFILLIVTHKASISPCLRLRDQ